MYLEKIELVGFKSFASKTTLIFPAKKNKEGFGLTAIVGPNGSGKSNLLEAIRWALGEQRLRILRAKKSEDLIFSGSSRQSRANLTEVSLFFNNEEGGSEIPWPQFSVSRRLNRHGESEYLINNCPTKLQDILLILAQANFGQKSYSIVGQGMISNLLHLGPLDRQAFFEEATGVRSYQIKKEEALRKLEKTKTNLESAQVALKEIEPQMRSLTRQIKKLERQEKIEKTLQERQKKYYSYLWQNLSYEDENLTKRFRKVEKNCQKEGSELKSLQNKFSDIFSETSINILESKQNEYKNLLKIKNEYLEKKIKLQEEILREEKSKDIRPEKIKIDPTKILEGIKELEGWINQLIKDLETISSPEQIAKIKEGLHKSLEKIIALKANFTHQPKTTVKKDNLLQQLKNQYQDILKELQELDEKINSLEQGLLKEAEQEKTKRKEVFALQKEIELKQKKFDELKEILNEIKIEQTKVRTHEETLKEEMKQELNLPIDDLKKISVDESPEVLEQEIRKFKHELELIGGIDPEIKKEYPQCRERYEFLSKEIHDLKRSLDSLAKITKELDRRVGERFNQSFSQISEKFDQYFRFFWGGGKAKLVLRKNIAPSPTEPVSDGETISEKEKEFSEIEIVAQPPKKRLKNIEALSGGESALTALALISAIIAINKPPFVILDEVDAALDAINSLHFAEILKDLARETQFILITHNLQVIKAAQFLYGTIIDSRNISKLVSLKLEKD